MNDEIVQTLRLQTAAAPIRMTAPADASDEPGGRISFWWGITSASLALARHIEEERDLGGTRVIELGCGLGLAGIVAGLRGARVTFTDCVPQALQYARRNARDNGLDAGRCEFQLLDWETPTETGTYQLIVGAEIAYDYFLHDSLLGLFQQLLEPGGRILVADRKRLVIQRFLGRLVHDGYRCTETRRLASMPDLPEQEISIFELARGAAPREA